MPMGRTYTKTKSFDIMSVNYGYLNLCNIEVAMTPKMYYQSVRHGLSPLQSCHQEGEKHDRRMRQLMLLRRQ